jgi:hypothetical protein
MSSDDQANYEAGKMYRRQARYYKIKARADLQVKKQQAAVYMQHRISHDEFCRKNNLPLVDLPQILTEDNDLLVSITAKEAFPSSESDSDRLKNCVHFIPKLLLINTNLCVDTRLKNQILSCPYR